MELSFQSPSGNHFRAQNLSSSMQVTVELKNDLAITGTLHSVDQYLNVKTEQCACGERAQVSPHGECKLLHAVHGQIFPFHHLNLKHQETVQQVKQSCVAVQMSVRNCFIRGSVVRYRPG